MTNTRIRKISFRSACVCLTASIALLAILGIVAWPGVRIHTLLQEGAITREQDRLALFGGKMESEIVRHISLLETESDTIGNILSEYREWDSLHGLLNTTLGQENLALLERQRRDRLLQGLITGVGRREPLIGDLRLIAPDGNIIAVFNRHQLSDSGNDGMTPEASPSGIVMPVNALEEGHVHIGPGGTRDGVPHMAIALPVDRGSEVVGTLVAEINVHALWLQTASRSPAHGVTYYLIDENGGLLAGAEDAKLPATGLPIQVELVRALRDGHEWNPNTPYPGISGVPVFGSAHPVRSLKGWVVSEVSVVSTHGTNEAG